MIGQMILKALNGCALPDLRPRKNIAIMRMKDETVRFIS